mmetsp:Transcript_39759/g.105978  ORF Transcript_39759/g.105978 Transcript_39759/m.105978 type:complete len:222 (-) Transcript_39759:1703-2368(-)
MQSSCARRADSTAWAALRSAAHLNPSDSPRRFTAATSASARDSLPTLTARDSPFDRNARVSESRSSAVSCSRRTSSAAARPTFSRYSLACLPRVSTSRRRTSPAREGSRAHARNSGIRSPALCDLANTASLAQRRSNPFVKRSTGLSSAAARKRFAARRAGLCTSPAITGPRTYVGTFEPSISPASLAAFALKSVLDASSSKMRQSPKKIHATAPPSAAAS